MLVYSIVVRHVADCTCEHSDIVFTVASYMEQRNEWLNPAGIVNCHAIFVVREGKLLEGACRCDSNLADWLCGEKPDKTLDAARLADSNLVHAMRVAREVAQCVCCMCHHLGCALRQ